MKLKYINPAIKVKVILVENLMQIGLSETPADPDQPVLGKDNDITDEGNWSSGGNVWED